MQVNGFTGCVGCGCVGVWLCGGVAVWLCGDVAVWVWVYGCVGVWYGSMGCGCMEVWLYGVWGYGGVAFILMRTERLSHSSACSEIQLVIKGVCCLLQCYALQ